MYYWPKHKLGFFHIPKTGGSSFGGFMFKALRKRGDDGVEIARVRWHEPIAEKRAVLGPEAFDEARLITTIRSPYATVVSTYFWYRLSWDEQHPNLDEYPEAETIAGMEFREFVDWYIENAPTFGEYLLLDGELPANLWIARLESVDSDADRILNAELGLGIEIKLRVRRKSEHGPYMSYLTPDDILRINAKHRWDFEHLYPGELIVP